MLTMVELNQFMKKSQKYQIPMLKLALIINQLTIVHQSLKLNKKKLKKKSRKKQLKIAQKETKRK